ncbi:urease accessory protein UreF [Rhodovulum sulfidophilum]|uniref:Urease accessory protein UreF n=1 Tax=Rhodovulum sulfidophilum TaxID=35806 RepID=A0ABS1RP35_RHOSU|nr:urease accessory protein UreF [Rhodovulum sulfidophilum]MBL3607815.1 urease accessory protein UreF [Rhodovulum sulfidophilum]MCE8457592.1 urease accessory protein UreF [Rhodovulum sulfidophilum]
MATDGQILRLAQWLSPAYPVGAFAYSHGLEAAVASGAVGDGTALQDWLEDILRFGAGRSDTIFLKAAHEARLEDLPRIDALARAFQPSAERRTETTAQGAAFAQVTSAVWPGDLPAFAYPVALGRAARLHDLPLGLTARMYLQAFVSNLVSAGIRLIPIGQTEGQRVLTALQPLCEEVAEVALTETLDDLAGTTFLADIASMTHETQYSRLFRT